MTAPQLDTTQPLEGLALVQAINSALSQIAAMIPSGGAGSGGALKAVLIPISKNLADADGVTQTINVGFQPTAVIFIVGISPQPIASIGIGAGASAGSIFQEGASVWANDGGAPIYLSDVNGNGQRATIQSVTATGLVLLWHKLGSATGTGAGTLLALG